MFSTEDPEVKHGKPAPDCFLVAASRFPHQPKPEQVIIFLVNNFFLTLLQLDVCYFNIQSISNTAVPKVLEVICIDLF